jgi:hypothetical protein
MQPPVKLISDGETNSEGIGVSKNEYKYMRTASGHTSYVTYPNKSWKILKNQHIKHSKYLFHHHGPVDDKPIGGLTGPILNEMVQLHEERKSWHSKAIKNKRHQAISRHGKLSATVFHLSR